MVVVDRVVAVGTAPVRADIDMTVNKVARISDERLFCITLVLGESFE